MEKLSKTILIGMLSAVLVVPYVMTSATFAESRILLISGKTSCGKGNKSIGDYSLLQKSDENQIDMHSFKEDCVGAGSGSLFNTYVNKDKSNVILVKISDKSVIVETYMSLQTVKDTFPISGKK